MHSTMGIGAQNGVADPGPARTVNRTLKMQLAMGFEAKIATGQNF